MPRPSAAILCCLLLAAPRLAAPAHAQQQLAAVQGTVADDTGGVLPGATITVTNIGTGVARTAVSNQAGVYRMPSLDPGVYRISAELAGFRTAVRDQLTLAVGATAGLDFTLHAGEVTEVVKVQGTAADIQTQKADVSAVVEQKKVSDLPLVGRNPLSLTALQPGVTGIPGQTDFLEPEQNSGLNVNGLRSSANSATVDGVSINGAPQPGSVIIVPNVEAVQEFQVVSNNPGAESGRNAGGSVNIVTKSGTNQLKGSVYEFHRGQSLRTKGIFDTTKPDFKRDDYGFSVGGPIRRDRSFFFASYEGVRQVSATSQLYTVETEAFRDYVLQTRPNSIAASLLKEYQPKAYPTTGLRDLGSPAPGANKIGPADGIMDIGTVTAALNERREGDQVNGRFDQVFGDGGSRLRSTYYLSDISTSFNYLRPTFDHMYPYRNQLFTIGHTKVLSDRTINEAAFGYMRMHGQTDDPTPQVPTIGITGLSGTAGFGVDYWHPIAFTQNYYQLKDTITTTRGKHSLRAGGEFQLTYQFQDFHHYQRPNYSFQNILDFADDEPYSERRAVDPATGLSTHAENHYRMIEYTFFVQDNWKVRQNVTATLGLRYENFGSPTITGRPFNNIQFGPGSTRQEQMAGAKSVPVDQLYPDDNNNFAPRVGLSWDVSGNATTVVRGGAGINYNRINNTVWSGEWQNPPYFATASTTILDATPILYTTGPDYPQNPGLGAGVDDKGGIKGARVQLRVTDPAVRTPYAYTWFGGVQRQLPGGFVAEVNYVGSAGRNLLDVDGDGGENYNRFAGDLLDGRLDRLNPSFAVISLAESVISSKYHGLTAQVSRRYRDGLAFQMAYTLGKVQDTAGNAVDPLRKDLEYGPANFDVRHRVAFNAVWSIPGSFDRALMEYVLGGWQLNAIAIYQTGLPVNVTTSAAWPNGDYNADGTNNDRPNAPAFGNDIGNPSQAEWLSGVFAAGDFPIPAAGTQGTLARNAYRAPNYFNTDLSLFKNVRLGHLGSGSEPMTVQVRVEAFNVFNHTNLNAPTSNLSSSLFGRVTSARPSREIQLGLKFLF